MPNRQYFCWKMCLKFHCGCMEYTTTQHVCNANRGVVCHKWMITRTTDKDCDTHRIPGLHGATAGGESDDNTDSGSPSPLLLLDLDPSLLEDGEWEPLGDDEQSDQDHYQQQQKQQIVPQGIPSQVGQPGSGSYEQAPRRRAAN